MFAKRAGRVVSPHACQLRAGDDIAGRENADKYKMPGYCDVMDQASKKEEAEAVVLKVPHMNPECPANSGVCHPQHQANTVVGDVADPRGWLRVKSLNIPERCVPNL